MTCTVIIPTLGRKSLGAALKSALENGEYSQQVIVVDDSSDQSVEVNYSNIKVLKTGGGKGVSFSRNFGIMQAKCDWIAFLDDDDVWNNDHLAKLLAFVEKHQLDVAISSAKLSNNAIRPRLCLDLHKEPFEALYSKFWLLKSDYYFPTSGFLIKTDLAKKELFDLSLSERENLDFLQRIFNEGANMMQSPQHSVTINYISRKSLARINLEEEVKWLRRLQKMNKNYSRNFRIASCRDFIRQRKVLNAFRMLIA